MFIKERRKNGALLQDALENHPDLLIQKEVGQSSWFGFSLVIKPGSNLSRKALVMKLTDLGFECRPIVTGNFAKNEVVKYFNSEIHGQLSNAEYIDQNGLFIGNHHYPIPDAFSALSTLI
jgi:CDP-6-deoxy-D-xylo-4-hexulose-3-dehydrase